MADVVGCLGYSGQDIQFLDSERFGFVTGRGIFIYDVKKGPREMIWSVKAPNSANRFEDANSEGDVRSNRHKFWVSFRSSCSRSDALWKAATT
jgi:hypothetical protein